MVFTNKKKKNKAAYVDLETLQKAFLKKSMNFFFRMEYTMLHTKESEICLFIQSYEHLGKIEHCIFPNQSNF